MTSKLQSILFPNGTRPLDTEWLKTEEAQYYNRNVRKLEMDYPIKHTALQAIAGTIPLKRSLPDWWNSAIDSSTYPLKFFLPSVTADEFFLGQVNEENWKLFRKFLPEDQKRLLPQSPKLGKILEDNPYLDRFTNRGQTVTNVDLVLTCEPEDIFYMSNGSGWNSCQHWKTGGYKHQLLGSMYEITTGIAYVLQPGKSSIRQEESILARALLRVMVHPFFPDIPCIVVDKRYGNDRSIEKGMLPAIIEHCVSKGYIAGTSYNYSRTYPDDYVFNQFTSPAISRPSDMTESYQDTLSYQAYTNVRYKQRDFILTALTGTVGAVRGISLTEE